MYDRKKGETRHILSIRCSESVALAMYPNTTIPMGLVNWAGTLDVSLSTGVQMADDNDEKQTHHVTVTVSPDCHTDELVGEVIGGSNTSLDKNVGRARATEDKKKRHEIVRVNIMETSLSWC